MIKMRSFTLQAAPICKIICFFAHEPGLQLFKYSQRIGVNNFTFCLAVNFNKPKVLVWYRIINERKLQRICAGEQPCPAFAFVIRVYNY